MPQDSKSAFAKIVILIIAVILSPLIVAGLLGHGLWSAFLYLAVWTTWCRKGPRVFVSYSRSPHWQARFEEFLIPRLPSTAIVVNWSDRKAWPRLSLRRLVFENFLGNLAHTPSVIVFRPFRRAQVFRFYEAYKRFKRGDQSQVLEQEAWLLRTIGFDLTGAEKA